MNQLENEATRAILKEAFERNKVGVLHQKAIKKATSFFPAVGMLRFYKVQTAGNVARPFERRCLFFGKR